MLNARFPQKKKRSNLSRTPSSIKTGSSPPFKKHREKLNDDDRSGLEEAKRELSFGSEEEDDELVDQGGEEEEGLSLQPPTVMGNLCAVCFVPDRFLPNEKAIQCSSCDILVHQSCYGAYGAYGVEERSEHCWECDPCHAKNTRKHKHKQCIFCRFGPQSGAMRLVTYIVGRQRRQEWIHVSCAIFGVHNYFADLNNLVICSLDVDSKIRECVICKSSSVGCVRCNYCDDRSTCDTWFHVVCAMASGAKQITSMIDHLNVHDPGVNPHKEGFYRMLARQGRISAKFDVIDENCASMSIDVDMDSPSVVVRNIEPLIRCSVHSDAEKYDPHLALQDRYTRKLSDLHLDSSRTKVGTEVCGVCFWDDDFLGNDLIVCENPRCDTVVHQWCYGVQDTQGPFICDVCKCVERPKAKCIVCSHVGGTLKKVSVGRRNGWAHVSCVVVHPEFKIGDVAEMSKIHISDRNVRKLNGSSFQKCFACDKRNFGAVTKCSDCDKTFHPTCVLSMKYSLHFVINSSGNRRHIEKPTSHCSLSSILKCNDHKPNGFDCSQRWKFIGSKSRLNEIASPMRPMVEISEEEEQEEESSSSSSRKRRFERGEIPVFSLEGLEEKDEWRDELRDVCPDKLDRRDCKNLFQCLEQVCIAKGKEWISKFQNFVKTCQLSFNQEAEFGNIYEKLSDMFDSNILRRVHKQAYTSLLDKDGNRVLFLSAQFLSTKGKCQKQQCGRESMFVTVCHSCGSLASQLDYNLSQYSSVKPKKRRKGKGRSSQPKSSAAAAAEIVNSANHFDTARCEEAILRALDYILEIYNKASNNRIKYHAGDVCFLLKNVCLKAKNGSKVKKRAFEVTKHILSQYLKLRPKLLKSDDELRLLGFLEAFHCNEQICELSDGQTRSYQSQIKVNLKRHSFRNILHLNPRDELPILTPEHWCSQCGEIFKSDSSNLGKRCYRCRRDTKQTVNFDRVTAAMIWMSVFEDVKVPFESCDANLCLEDIMKFLPFLRPYRSLSRLGKSMFVYQSYFVTHMIFIAANRENQNCWSDVRLDPSLFIEEFLFLVINLKTTIIDLKNAELVGEFLQCLRVFGVPEDSCLIQIGVRYLLEQEARGAKGSFIGANYSFYTRYHAAYCGIIGLAHEGIFPYNPKLQMCEKWRKLKYLNMCD